MPANRLRVLLVADEGSGDPAASWRLAGALAARHDVILAVPAPGGQADHSFAVVYYNSRNITLLARDSDIVVLGPGAASLQSQLLGMGSLAAISLSALMEGGFDRGRPLRAPVPAGDLQPGELFVVRPVPARPPNPGLSHHLARFRFHLRRGGPRLVAAKTAAKLKRKIGRG